MNLLALEWFLRVNNNFGTPLEPTEAERVQIDFHENQVQNGPKHQRDAKFGPFSEFCTQKIGLYLFLINFGGNSEKLTRKKGKLQNRQAKVAIMVHISERLPSVNRKSV